MTTIQEQIAQAKAAGYDDAAITKHLSGLPEYSGKVKTALDAGYQPSDILGYLAPMTVTAKRQNVQPEVTRGDLYRRELQRVAAPFAGLSKGVGNVMFGGQKLLGMNLEALGADETGKALIADAAKRKLEQEKFIAPYKEVAPGMTATGEFGGEVLTTAPAGGFIGKGVTAVGQAVPQVARFTAPLGTSIQSGGFRTGMATPTTIGGKIIEKGVQGAGGAVIGGTTAALLNAEDAGTGAGFGAAIPLVVPATMQKIASGVGKVVDMRKIPTQKAANILRESIGGDVDEVVNALRNAKPGVTPAQALADAGLNEPVAQALLQRAAEREPKFFTDLLKKQDVETANKLANLAGGTTETATRATLDNMKNALNAMTGPQRDAALNRANLGKAVTEYESRAGKLSKEAAAKVQEVRDLINAGNKAEAWAKLQVIKQGLPTSTARYTYADELAQKAFNEWSDKAASASLDLGQGAQFAGAAADTLRRNGVNPIQGSVLARQILGIADNPTFAGNDVVSTAVRRVADDIAAWTNSGGVIDAQALASIRKNSVNAAIRDLLKGEAPSVQRQTAASVMVQIKPFIDDTIEAAGGTGWKKYLANYTKGSQDIAARKLSAEARTLYRESPDLFVKLVELNSPEAVEKIMGKGNYNLALQLSEDAMETLAGAAKQITSRGEMAKQATAGEKALVDLMGEHTAVLKIPNWFDPRITTANKALDIVEKKVGKATLAKLTEAAKTAKGFDDLLNTLPASDRIKVLKAIKDPKVYTELKETGRKITGASAVGVNALSPKNEQNQNALAR
jgi:hypothetical protein